MLIVIAGVWSWCASCHYSIPRKFIGSGMKMEKSKCWPEANVSMQSKWLKI